MKKLLIVILLFIMLIATSVLPVLATRAEGINGFVEHLDSHKMTVGGKSYRLGKLFRVIIVTREGIHRYEKEGSYSDVRVGEKVSAVVIYDEMGTIYLERY